MTKGIYTLANDVVYNQLIALLNSIEVNVGPDFPVCVVPYDDRIEKIRAEIETRPNVTLITDPARISPWDEFAEQAWRTHPTAMKSWEEKGIKGVHRSGTYRRYCAFDPESPFEKFIYCDADLVVLNSLDIIFKALEQQDFVVYDFQYKDLSHVFNGQSKKLLEIFKPEEIEQDIFCSGFYGSQRGLFNQEQRQWVLSKLSEAEAEVLYPNSADQSLLNYMRMRLGIPLYNLVFHLPKEQVTGNSVTSPHFEMRDTSVYDKGQRLTYLHYIGLSSKLFDRLCAGENLDIPYRDIFLHYRYLHEPSQRPQFTTPPKPYNPPPSLVNRVIKKLGLTR